MAETKTNALRIIEKAGISYKHIIYDSSVTEGLMVAEIIGQDKNRVYKTLVTVSASKEHYVFVIPVEKTLDLKKAAKSVSEKSVSMIKQKELLPLTGYIHGGCSPVGMKKQFVTVIDKSAEKYQTIFVSAGRVGNQMEISPIDLLNLIRGSFADLTL